MNSNTTLEILKTKPAYTLTGEENAKIIASELEKIFSAEQKPKPLEKKIIRGIHGLAKELNLSPVTVQKLKNSGKIPYSQYARVVLFDLDAVLLAISNKKK